MYTLDKLIEELQKARKQHGGDIPVLAFAGHGPSYPYYTDEEVQCQIFEHFGGVVVEIYTSKKEKE
jgi:hypothetical protein